MNSWLPEHDFTWPGLRKNERVEKGEGRKNSSGKDACSGAERAVKFLHVSMVRDVKGGCSYGNGWEMQPQVFTEDLHNCVSELMEIDARQRLQRKPKRPCGVEEGLSCPECGHEG